jgi:shikimate kinase
LDYNVSKTIALVGLMGAGKTAIGLELSKRLGVPFLDTDQEIEKAANMSIAEIFERDGEPFFRLKESQVLERLIHSDPCVLSTGGGAFVSPDNREIVSGGGVSVWLDVGLDILWDRVSRKDTRPLLHVVDPYQKLAELYNERLPFYQQADLSVKGAFDLSIDAMTDRVIDVLLADGRSGVTQREEDGTNSSR